MNMKLVGMCLVTLTLGYSMLGCADAYHNESTPAGRLVPSRLLPVPSDVSRELQDSIRQAASAPDSLGSIPATPDEWRAAIAMYEKPEQVREHVEAIKEKFPVHVTAGTMAGIKVYVVNPMAGAERSGRRAFVYVHGGAYISGAGEAGLDEAILIAYHTGMKVISVDYRMPPDSPFPAAVDDSVAVWKEVIRECKPANVGLGGTSAGGGLALAVVLRLKELKLPLPGAIYAGTPWADLTNSGDSTAVNDHVDSALSGGNEWLLAAGRWYAGGHDMRDPLISPVFGDFSKFPPTILLTGTRDFLLSDTVRVHRKLRLAGVEANLHVFEAMSHADYATLPDSPESREAYREIALFLDKHLGR